jgi:hypothetical protein
MGSHLQANGTTLAAKVDTLIPSGNFSQLPDHKKCPQADFPSYGFSPLLAAGDAHPVLVRISSHAWLASATISWYLPNISSAGYGHRILPGKTFDEKRNPHVQG